MSTMVSEVYDALLEAGASEQKARRAAEAVAGFDQHFASLERKVDLGFAEARQERAELKSELKQELAEVKSEQKLVRWMLGVLVAGVATLILKAFF